MRISVAIPTYRSAWSLPMALDSLLMQSRRPSEVHHIMNAGCTTQRLYNRLLCTTSITLFPLYSSIAHGIGACTTHGSA